MISRSLGVVLLAGGCLTAAAGGSYLAVRQNAAQVAVAEASMAETPAPAAATGGAVPVAETEAVVARPADPVAAPAADPVAAPAAAPIAVERAERVTPRPMTRRQPARDVTPPAAAAAEVPVEAVATPAPAAPEPARVEERPQTAPAQEPTPAQTPEPVIDEIVIPASAVIGLEVDRTITSEQAQVEDRVDARVTRDVYANGRIAIPAGTRVIGNVTLVERGGKIKDRARLGVRFHTLVLGDGRQVAVRTDTIYREGASPGAESSRKIGGAAIGGAVLGAILGGGKGAATGAAVGAAGGTAAVMAGGRNAATMNSGSIVTVRLSAPATIEVER